MTTQGYVFMTIAWGIVLALAAFSVTRLLRRKKG
jgi:uncharacterized membrane protein